MRILLPLDTILGSSVLDSEPLKLVISVLEFGPFSIDSSVDKSETFEVTCGMEDVH